MTCSTRDKGSAGRQYHAIATLNVSANPLRASLLMAAHWVATRTASPSRKLEGDDVTRVSPPFRPETTVTC